MNVHTDPLVDDYLRRLDAAASALPAHQREELISEIRDHLQEALRQAPASDEAAVRNLLERLGAPEEIAAADDPAPPGHLVAPYRDGLEARLEAVQLRPLSEVAQRKLQRRAEPPICTPASRQGLSEGGAQIRAFCRCHHE